MSKRNHRIPIILAAIIFGVSFSIYFFLGTASIEEAQTGRKDNIPIVIVAGCIAIISIIVLFFLFIRHYRDDKTKDSDK